MKNSVCLNRKFNELPSLSKEQLKEEVLTVLDSIGYSPKNIIINKANKGTMGEIKVPVEFDETEAMDNWMIQRGLSPKSYKKIT